MPKVAAGKEPPAASAEAYPPSGKSPADAPRREWADIAAAVWARIGENRVVAVAAGLTFYALLAIFPGVTAIVSIYGLFADPASISVHMGQFNGILPEGGISVIGDQIALIANQRNDALGLAFFVGLLTSIWSANAGVKALFDAMNVAYGVSETRSFVRLNALSLTFTASFLLLAIVALGGAVALPIALQAMSLRFDDLAVLANWLRWPVLALVGIASLALVYRYGPAGEERPWRWITPGSVFASIVWLLASAAFAYYSANFGSYNKTYGTLGAVIGFMTWIWVSAIVVMIGAEINAETEGAAKPAVQSKN